MKRLLLLLVGGTLLLSCTQPKQEEAAPPAPQALEFADAKYTDLSRQSLVKLAEGNVDEYGSVYADNAVFMWNNGDSIVSKQAILDYWRGRRASVIDTISFTNEAWMAVQANDPPKHIAKGVWVFNWATFTIAYTTGKSVTMSIHNVFHFDANDKVDRAIQYLDRAPVAAALAKK